MRTSIVVQRCLFAFHKCTDFVVAADEEEDDAVGKFENDAIFEGGANFPVVACPVFEAESFGQWRLPIEIVHECVDGFICFLLAGPCEPPEPAVEAWFEFVFHDYCIIFLRCSLAAAESEKVKPLSFSTSASLAASFS